MHDFIWWLRFAQPAFFFASRKPWDVTGQFTDSLLASEVGLSNKEMRAPVNASIQKYTHTHAQTCCQFAQPLSCFEYRQLQPWDLTGPVTGSFLAGVAGLSQKECELRWVHLSNILQALCRLSQPSSFFEWWQLQPGDAIEVVHCWCGRFSQKGMRTQVSTSIQHNKHSNQTGKYWQGLRHAFMVLASARRCTTRAGCYPLNLHNDK